MTLSLEHLAGTPTCLREPRSTYQKKLRGREGEASKVH